MKESHWAQIKRSEQTMGYTSTDLSQEGQQSEQQPSRQEVSLQRSQSTERDPIPPRPQGQKTAFLQEEHFTPKILNTVLKGLFEFM